MLAGRKVLVAGAGVTGRSVAQALLGMGAHVTVTDAAAERLTDLPPGATTVVGLADKDMVGGFFGGNGFTE